MFVFLLDQVKDRDSVAHRREQAGSVGREEQVALAVDGAEQIGELGCAWVSVIVSPRLARRCLP